MIHPVMIKRIFYTIVFIVIANALIGDFFDAIGLTELGKCDALTSDGYSDNITGQWWPKSCSLHHYQKSELTACLKMKQVNGEPMRFITVGDSRVRQMFAEFVNYIDPSLEIPYDGHYSRNRSIASLGAYFEFNWLPLLSSVDKNFLERVLREKPSMLIISHGPHDIAFTDRSIAPQVYRKEIQRLAPYLEKMTEKFPVIWRVPYRSVVPTNYSLTIQAFNSYIAILLEELPESVIQWWSSKYHLDRSINLFKDPIHAGKKLDGVDSQILYNFYCNDVSNNLDTLTCFTSSCIFVKRLILILIFGASAYVILYFILPKFQGQADVIVHND